jgi:hypothetical protein
MATVKTNPIIEQVRGKVGDLVFKKYGAHAGHGRPRADRGAANGAR